jgi:hypothetical protein
VLLEGLSGCGSREKTFKVKLAFHFESPRGAKVFSGVWEIWETRVSDFPNPGTSLNETLIGEAIPMRFDNGRVVFALLVNYGGGDAEDVRGLWSVGIGPALYGALGPSYRDLGEYVAAGAIKSVPLAPRDMPALVTFENLADPATGRFVPLAELSEIAGPGWTFNRTEIQVVQNPPTLGASQLLPWISALPTDPDNGRWDNFSQHPEYFVRKPPAW